eukprot:10974374-Lingulodinium_polyedra.AAC.1
MQWRAHDARARGACRLAEAANRAFDRIVVLRKMLHNDAVKRAVRRLTAAKCAKHARAMQTP